MQFATINTTGVIAAVFASMVLGALWYSPLVMGKQWMAAAGISPKMNKEMISPAKAIALCLLLTIGVVIILDQFMKRTTADSFAEGATIALWYWALAMLIYGIHAIFEGKSLKLFAISALHELVNFALIGGILVTWH
jgi:Protein of unknown function (DUF1761)